MNKLIALTLSFSVMAWPSSGSTEEIFLCSKETPSEYKIQIKPYGANLVRPEKTEVCRFTTRAMESGYNMACNGTEVPMSMVFVEAADELWVRDQRIPGMQYFVMCK